MTEDEPPDLFGAEVVQDILRSQLNTASLQYEADINRLWAGCGGGLITVVTVLRYPGELLFWLSILSFGLGILSLAIGAFLTLNNARKRIEHLERIASVLEMKFDFAEPPSHKSKLVIRHPQTLTALIATGLFCIGLIATGALLACI